MVYMGIIIYAAQRFEGDEWRVYDANFRKQAVALHLPKWAAHHFGQWHSATRLRESTVHTASAWTMPPKSAKRQKRKEQNTLRPLQRSCPSAETGTTENAALLFVNSGTSASSVTAITRKVFAPGNNRNHTTNPFGLRKGTSPTEAPFEGDEEAASVEAPSSTNLDPMHHYNRMNTQLFYPFLEDYYPPLMLLHPHTDS